MVPDPKEVTFNFHLADGVYFRRHGDNLHVVRARGFDEPGELIFRTDLSGLASIVSGLSPHKEQNGSYDYVLRFMKDGTMHCGGCGCRLGPDDQPAGTLSIVNLVSCIRCYEQKFKPLFDYAATMRPR